MITWLSRKTLHVAVASAAFISLSFVPAAAASAGEKKVESTASQTCAGTPSIPSSGIFICWEKDQPGASDSATPDSTNPYCDSHGNCWNRQSSTVVLFTGGTADIELVRSDGTKVVLGHARVNAQWTLTGTKISEKGALYTDIPLIDIWWDGSLYNGAAGTNGGTELKQCTYTQGALFVDADTHTDSPPNWCTLSDNANYDHNMDLDVQYSVEGESGVGHYNVRSVVSHDPTLPATAYTFDAPNALPLNPANVWWAD